MLYLDKSFISLSYPTENAKSVSKCQGLERGLEPGPGGGGCKPGGSRRFGEFQLLGAPGVAGWESSSCEGTQLQAILAEQRSGGKPGAVEERRKELADAMRCCLCPHPRAGRDWGESAADLREPEAGRRDAGLELSLAEQEGRCFPHGLFHCLFVSQ